MRQLQEQEEKLRRHNDEQARLLKDEGYNMQREEEEILRQQDIERQKLA